MLTEIFKSVLLMSVVGGILSVFLLCVKPITRKLFSPKWQYYIWLMVLIVMVLPVSFSLPKNTPDIPDVMTEQVQNVPTEFDVPADNQNTITEMQTQSKKFFVPKINLSQDIWEYLSVTWLFTAAVILLMRITKYYLFLRTIRKHSSKDTSLVDIPKRIEVRRTDMLDAPLIIGLINPVLYLPDTELSEDNLNYILMHELTHYKRHDLLYKWVALIIKSVHWFNPLVYLVSKQIDLDCEVSCDFAVTSNLTQDEQNNYMNMILDMLVNSQSNLRPLTTQMASSKKTLKRRFEMMKNKKVTNKIVSIISVVIAIVMLSTTVFASGLLSAVATDDYQLDSTNNSVSTTEFINQSSLEDVIYSFPVYEVDLDKDTELLKEYERYGMSYTNGKMFYNNKIVRYFIDGYEFEDGLSAIRYEYLNKSGVIDIHVIREVEQNSDGSINHAGNIIDIVPYSQEEFDKRNVEDLEQPVLSEATSVMSSSEEVQGETFEERFNKYKEWGITYQEITTSEGTSRNVYYKGQLIRKFADVSESGGVFSFESTDEGNIKVKCFTNPYGITLLTVYDITGKLISVDTMNINY